MVKIKCPHCNKEFETEIIDESITEDIPIVEIGSWKGKGEVEITSIDKKKKKLILRQYHKSKETGENYFQDSEVLFEDLENLWDLLKEHCEIGQEYGSHYIWRLIIIDKKLNEIEGVTIDYMIQHFLGYRQKKKGTDYFFRYYYNLIKVLEKFGWLIYFGRGGIMLLDKGDLGETERFK